VFETRSRKIRAFGYTKARGDKLAWTRTLYFWAI